MIRAIVIVLMVMGIVSCTRPEHVPSSLGEIALGVLLGVFVVVLAWLLPDEDDEDDDDGA